MPPQHSRHACHVHHLLVTVGSCKFMAAEHMDKQATTTIGAGAGSTSDKYLQDLHAVPGGGCLEAAAAHVHQLCVLRPPVLCQQLHQLGTSMRDTNSSGANTSHHDCQVNA